MGAHAGDVPRKRGIYKWNNTCMCSFSKTAAGGLKASAGM